MTRQSRGYKGKVRLMFEDSFRTLGATPTAWVLPILNESLDVGRSLSQKQTLTGKNAPGRPFAQNLAGNGSMSLALGVHAVGVYLRALCGSPTTTVYTDSETLDAGAVTEEGRGRVGLPCEAHGFPAYALVTVSGTSNYDGVYTVEPESTADKIVIRASYAEETLVGTETVSRGATRSLDAAIAVDKGDGLVGIPCTGHGYLRGETVSITGTSGYDGDHVVQAGSTKNEIIIEDTYSSETFTGTETVAPKYYKHVFKLQDTMPSFTVEREADLESGDDDEKYFEYYGCKAGSLSMDVGGDGQLTAAMDVSPSDRELLESSLSSSDVELADYDFENFDGEIFLSGTKAGNITKINLQVQTNLDDAQYCVGDKGKRSSLPEGQPNLSGNFTTQYKDNAMWKKAKDGEELELTLRLVNGANQLGLTFPEIRIQESGAHPKLSGPQGTVQEFQFMAYQDDNTEDTGFMAELINGYANYAA